MQDESCCETQTLRGIEASSDVSPDHAEKPAPVAWVRWLQPPRMAAATAPCDVVTPRPQGRPNLVLAKQSFLI